MITASIQKHITVTLIVLCTVVFSSKTTSAQFSDTRMSYGAKLGLNYSLIGAKYRELGGSVMPTFGMFFSRELTSVLSLKSEVAYSGIRFRETQQDKLYNLNYLDANVFLNVYTSPTSKDLSFLVGIKPYYLLSYSTELFQTGSYLMINDANNKNERGSIGFAGYVGMSVALSPVVELELIYAPGFDDKNAPNTILGRPSSVEIGIRLNAVAIQDQFAKSQLETKNTVKQLSKGVLLVMLTTPNSAEIELLKSQGKFAEISMINNEYTLRNKRVMQAFTNQYNFTDVYYFYDTTANSISVGNFAGKLVDRSLNVNSSITIPDSTSFFIASFCEDVSKYTNRAHYGLYIYDRNFIQYDKPFNVPSQLVSIVIEGDPLNFLKTRRTNYSAVPFEKYVSKFNGRLKVLNED